MAANEEVRTTRLTAGAYFLMASRIDVVPLMAGSRISVFGSVNLKWNGDAVCWTYSMPGIWMTSSKALGCAMSGTRTTVSFAPGCASRMILAFSSVRTVVTTSWPPSRSCWRMWAGELGRGPRMLVFH